MAKCWTCGTYVSGHHYTCSTCQSLTELKSLQKKAASHGRDVSEQLDYIAQVQREGFATLGDTLSTGLSEVASAIEWGFVEISWQLQQQTDVLRSIDHTLKTPGETQANEWRRQAEELRYRGVLEESEEFFLKALNEYRLDYRIYVGLAKTYLLMNKFDKAKSFLEKSLPHAPKGKYFDWKSNSYRLIGHIYACEEDYEQATLMLSHSISFSPIYKDGQYDYAQYSAQMKKEEESLSALRKAILADPLYWYLSQYEKNFNPIRNQVNKLISNIHNEASCMPKNSIDKAEKALNSAREVVSDLKRLLTLYRDKATIESITMYENAESKLIQAKEKVASGDYQAFLDAKLIAEESSAIAVVSERTAKKERTYVLERRKEKVKNAWKAAPVALLVIFPFFLFMGHVTGVALSGRETVGGGFIIGLIVGLICAISFIKNELQ